MIEQSIYYAASWWSNSIIERFNIWRTENIEETTNAIFQFEDDLGYDLKTTFTKNKEIILENDIFICPIISKYIEMYKIPIDTVPCKVKMFITDNYVKILHTDTGLSEYIYASEEFAEDELINIKFKMEETTNIDIFNELIREEKNLRQFVE